MATTIPTQFDPKTLPAWARRYSDVVALAEADLAFRCDVCSAKSKVLRQVLISEAERIMNYRLSRKS